jgi:hypothetical protein
MSYFFQNHLHTLSQAPSYNPLEVGNANIIFKTEAKKET